jgi:mannose-6-phosphate isomerase-like protein (cupin superfamily)
VTLAPVEQPRTWFGVAGSGIVEFDAKSVDIAGNNAAVPPGSAVNVRVSGPVALQIVEITRAV